MRYNIYHMSVAVNEKTTRLLEGCGCTVEEYKDEFDVSTTDYRNIVKVRDSLDPVDVNENWTTYTKDRPTLSFVVSCLVSLSIMVAICIGIRTGLENPPMSFYFAAVVLGVLSGKLTDRMMPSTEVEEAIDCEIENILGELWTEEYRMVSVRTNHVTDYMITDYYGSYLSVTVKNEDNSMVTMGHMGLLNNNLIVAGVARKIIYYIVD